MTHYCRPGPGCNVAAWRGFHRLRGDSVEMPSYFIRFGSALVPDGDEERRPYAEITSLDLFADTMAALRRAGFLIPDAAFRRISDEIAARDAAIAADKARQIDMFAISPQDVAVDVG